MSRYTQHLLSRIRAPKATTGGPSAGDGWFETPAVASSADPRALDSRLGFGRRRWLTPLLTIAVAWLAFTVTVTLFSRYQLDGDSMAPTLRPGELLLIQRQAYRFATPQRGDIVVFNSPLHADRRLVKRIIGLPGDTIIMTPTGVDINGAPLDEPYATPALSSTGTWQVPSGHYFMLGDNRPHSIDSRVWSFLPQTAIEGKAWRIIWPLSAARPISDTTPGSHPKFERAQGVGRAPLPARSNLRIAGTFTNRVRRLG